MASVVLVGLVDPRGWWLLQDGARDVACSLHGSDHVELFTARSSTAPAVSGARAISR